MGLKELTNALTVIEEVRTACSKIRRVAYKREKRERMEARDKVMVKREMEKMEKANLSGMLPVVSEWNSQRVMRISSGRSSTKSQSKCNR